MKLRFSSDALEDLSRLPKSVARRIIDKMEWFAIQEDPLVFAKPLKDSAQGDYRFRIGDYRVIVDIEKGIISILVVLAVRDRKDAYRR